MSSNCSIGKWRHRLAEMAPKIEEQRGKVFTTLARSVRIGIGFSLVSGCVKFWSTINIVVVVVVVVSGLT